MSISESAKYLARQLQREHPHANPLNMTDELLRRISHLRTDPQEFERVFVEEWCRLTLAVAS